jgi:hypothetical protein
MYCIIYNRRSEKMEEGMEEIKKREQFLLRALALSWAVRAMGKMSHAGFNACMAHVKSIVPDSVWNKYGMGKDNLHHHPGIERFVREVKQEIPPEIRELVGGDMPSINRIERELDELERWENGQE